jgi:hypothetical protein
MIDYLKFSVQGLLHRPIAAGAVIATHADGETEWKVARWHELRGEAGALLRARSGPADESDGFSSTLEIDVSPAKFLQGHNLYGSDDAQALAYECAARVLVQAMHARAARDYVQSDPCEQATVLHALARAIAAPVRYVRSPNGERIADESAPCTILRRVDINYMTRLADDAEVRAYLAHAGKVATVRNRSGTLTGATTLYFGAPKSREYRVRLYAKGPELTHRPPSATRNTAEEHHPQRCANSHCFNRTRTTHCARSWSCGAVVCKDWG